MGSCSWVVAVLLLKLVQCVMLLSHRHSWRGLQQSLLVLSPVNFWCSNLTRGRTVLHCNNCSVDRA